MQINDEHKDCRFWMCEPVACVYGRNRADLATRNAITAKIKAAGFKPIRYGFAARIAAVGYASKIEKATGIEMSVGRHDYL